MALKRYWSSMTRKHRTLAAADSRARGLRGVDVRQRSEAKAQSQRADAYLVDVRLPDGSGIDLVRWMKTNAGFADLMISGHGTIADAVEATRRAFDFLEKPLGREKVLVSLKNASRETKLRDGEPAAAEMWAAAAAYRRKRRVSNG